MSLTSYRAAPPRVKVGTGYRAQPGVLIAGFLTKSLGLLHPASKSDRAEIFYLRIWATMVALMKGLTTFWGVWCVCVSSCIRPVDLAATDSPAP